MNVLDKLIGQVVMEVWAEEENAGLRLSKASVGFYAPVDGTSLNQLLGQAITEVHHIEDQYLELRFSGGHSIRVILAPDVQSGPEAYAVYFDGGPIVVG